MTDRIGEGARSPSGRGVGVSHRYVEEVQILGATASAYKFLEEMMTVTVTKRLRDQLLKLAHDRDEFWERLSDITEHPPEWLREMCSGEPTKVMFEVVRENEEYGQVKAFA